MKRCFEDGAINLTPIEPVTNNNRSIPYFMLTDNAFALRTFLTKPYSKHDTSDTELITNYRLSIGRRMPENAFGILASKWQAFPTTLQQKMVTVVAEGAMYLRCLMRMRYPGQQKAELDHDDVNHIQVPGEWRKHVLIHEPYRARRPNQATTEATEVSETLLQQLCYVYSLAARYNSH